jgi:hypothetical protein
MKKLSLLIAITLFVTAIGQPSTTSATTLIDTTAATSIGTALDSTQTVNPASIREKIRANYDIKTQDLKANQATRNALIEQRTDIKNTAQTNIKTIRGEAKSEINAASTTIEKREIRKEMRKDILAVTKQKMAKQLELSLSNLTQIRDRIASRIEKEKQNTRDMTKATALLVVADSKISAAKSAVAALSSYSPSQISEDATSSTTGAVLVNIEKVRDLLATAQRSIKEAQKALNDVVVAIAKSMGLKIGQKSTSPTNTVTPTPSSTSNVTN